MVCDWCHIGHPCGVATCPVCKKTVSKCHMFVDHFSGLEACGDCQNDAYEASCKALRKFFREAKQSASGNLGN